MLRTILDETRLTNSNLCGIDTEFCYPAVRPYDVIIFIRPDLVDITNVGFDIINNAGAVVDTVNFADLYKYFAYAKAYDTNGDLYFIMRQTRPFYNLGGTVNPEINCYRLDFIIGDGLVPGTIVHYYTEPVCNIEKYSTNYYTIIAATADTNDIDFYIRCDGGPTAIYNYNTLALGMWLEYIGPFVNLVLPDNCVLIEAKLGGVTLVQDFVVVEFGQSNCDTFATITGSGKLNYDCKNRFYTDTFDTGESGDPTYFYHLDVLPNYLDDFRMHIPGGKVKQLPNKVTPKRFKQSCYLPTTETVSSWKIGSTCPCPPWFVEEINILAASQGVTIEGTNPIADDNNNLISLLQADDYNWKPRNYSDFLYPYLVFNTCTCFTNFYC